MSAQVPPRAAAHGGMGFWKIVALMVVAAILAIGVVDAVDDNRAIDRSQERLERELQGNCPDGMWMNYGTGPVCKPAPADD